MITPLVYTLPYLFSLDVTFLSSSSMRTTFPTARPTHTLAHFIEADYDPPGPGFIFLGRSHPTDPLVARQGRDICPHISHDSVRLNRLA